MVEENKLPLCKDNDKNKRPLYKDKDRGNSIGMLIVILLIMMGVIGCGNPRAEAFQKYMKTETTPERYNSIGNFLKDKNAIMQCDEVEGVGSGGNYQREFQFNITDEQYKLVLEDIRKYSTDDKITNTEYFGIMTSLKKYHKETLDKANNEMVKNIKQNIQQGK